jgi:hypothetical protein
MINESEQVFAKVLASMIPKAVAGQAILGELHTAHQEFTSPSKDSNCSQSVFGDFLSGRGTYRLKSSEGKRPQ